MKNNILKKFIVYKIINNINNKVYIGSTKTKLNIRWSEHKWTALTKKSDTPLYRSIRKYGIENFQIIEIFNVFKLEDLYKIEDYFIEYYKTLHPEGFNLVRATRTDDVNDKRRLIMKEIWKDPETKIKRIKLLREGSKHRFKPIVSVNIYTSEVLFYENVNDVGRAGFSISSIYGSLNKRCKTGQKHCWFYKTSDDVNFYKEETLKLINRFKEEFNKPIIATNIETKEEFEFKTIFEAKIFGFKPKCINRVLKGKNGRTTYKGFQWKYK